jgi:T5SS/PEP-CTERM-associated repeat protein/autotransporter-associated beta strand protein
MVANGGTVSVGGDPVIGNQAGSNGTITVTDPSSTFNVNCGLFLIGSSGNGTLAIENGGVVNDTSSGNGNDSVFIGYTGGGNGTVTVDGSGSQLNVSGGAVVAGYGGNASLTISNGGYANFTAADACNVSAYLGYNSNATAEVTGSGSKLRVANGELVLGEDAAGTLTVDNGGTVSSHGTILGDSANGTGTLLISDSGTHYNAYTGAILVGNHGWGNLSITNGGELKSLGADASNISMYVGDHWGSAGTVEVFGGALQLRDGGMVVGNSGDGTLTVDGGGYVSIASGNILDLAVNSCATGTVNLNSGGTISLGGTDALQSGSGDAAFNLGGGTLRVHGSDFSTEMALTLVDSTTSTVNTNGYNATVNGIVSGTGNLNVSGNGTLIFNGNNTYTGATNVTSGNLVVNGLSNSSVTVTNAGSALGGNGTIGGDVTLNSGGVVSPGIGNSVPDNMVSGVATLTASNVAASLATLTVTGNLTWNVTASTIPWHLSNTDNTSDLLNVLGNVTNTGDTAATLLFDFQNTGFYDGVPADSTYTLITSSNDMSNAGLSLSQFQAENIDSNLYDASNQSYFLYINGGTTLEFVIVPEPSMWGLLAGGVMLAFAGLRRKRNLKA